MRLFIAVAALLLLSLSGPVPASAATPSLPSVHNGRLTPGGDRPAPGGVQQRTHGETLTAQHHNSHDSVHNTTQQKTRDFPCPDEQDIAPCTCSVDDNLRLSMDCSAVVSDEQLAAVFTAYFPVTEYYEFRIYQNDNIELLGYILNGVTFQLVNLIEVFNLKSISDEFLLDSSGTLVSLDIKQSALTRGMFPFMTLPLYSRLRSLSITYSPQLTSIPQLISDSLTSIDFSGCAISNIDPGTFDAVPLLQTLDLYANDIESVQPGTFDALTQLQSLNVGDNELSSLQTGTITITNSLQSLIMPYNQLTTIEPGAFVVPENSGPTSSSLTVLLNNNKLSSLDSNTIVMTDRPHKLYLYYNGLSSLAAGVFVLPQTTDQFSLYLDLHNNALTVLEEQVLGALFPYITVLHVHANPLACGCDVAWLVLNPEYMAKVGDEDYVVTCADGRVFQDLDPAYYEAFC